MPIYTNSTGGPTSSQKARQTLGGKTVLGIAQGKRHRKVLRDTIHGISTRLARRGGVKRISAMIYDNARAALKDFLEDVLRDACTYVEYRNAKTVTVEDVLHSLRRRGRTLYGFDQDTWTEPKTHRRQDARRKPFRADRMY
ncbi:histone-fold-containing protein [Trichoderma novae-zelandiae]